METVLVRTGAVIKLGRKKTCKLTKTALGLVKPLAWPLLVIDGRTLTWVKKQKKRHEGEFLGPHS